MKGWMMKRYKKGVLCSEQDNNLLEEPEDVFMERMKKLAAENPLLDLAKRR